ncbi:MAG: hypothetical protein SGILL_009685, partial [Bacillariaceae sp.]
MSASASSSSSTLVDAVLPRDLPKGNSTHFLSVFCHAGGLKWGLHQVAHGSFAPIVFWYTPVPSTSDLRGDKCQALHTYLPSRGMEYVFGSSSKEGNLKQMAAEQARQRSPSALTVFFLTSASSQIEQNVASLFAEIPSRLLKLKPEHFFPASAQRGGKLHSIMTTDRLASLYAAKITHSAARGVLILQGSDTLNYTAMDSNGLILGGGVSPGINMRFRSMFDYGLVDNYPNVEWNDLRQKIREHVRSENGGQVKEPFVDTFSVTIEKGMVAGVISEVAGHVRNVVKQFLQTLDSRSKSDASQEPPHTPAVVLIEGFDNEFLHDLLTENVADIIPPEPDAEMPPKRDVEYGIRKNLTIYGVQQLLQACSKRDEPVSPDDELRDSIQGLRGAKKKSLVVNGQSKSDTYRCTVFNVIRADTFDDDLFELMYDANGEKEIVDVKGLYDAIRLYLEVGEDGPEINTQAWVEKKKTATQVVAAKLVETNGIAKARQQELDQAAAAGKSVADAMSGAVPAKKKRAREDKDDPATKTKEVANSIQSRDPREFLGRRVAKFFDDDLFFGYVDFEKKDEEDGEQLWHVTYDDDDQEDYDHKDLKNGMLLYIEKE